MKTKIQQENKMTNIPYTKNTMTNFSTFFEENMSQHIFRMWKLRRVGDWTPYEMEQKFSDESQLEFDECEFVKFVQAIELPDKDILLEYVDPWGNEENVLHHYVKLSQIEFSRFDDDDYNEDDVTEGKNEL